LSVLLFVVIFYNSYLLYIIIKGTLKLLQEAKLSL